MSKTRVVLNGSGFRALLRGPELRGDLMRRGQQIATAAGPGHGVEERTSSARARVAVSTNTAEAARAEAKRRTLTRAIDAGRH